MKSSTLKVPAADGIQLHVHRWLPDSATQPRAVVQVAHGLAEHGARYARFAQTLTDAGYAAYANDHRGHGHTAAPADLGFFADAGGWEAVVEDQRAVTDAIAQAPPGVPIVLFGHSMGSFIARAYAARHGSRLAALILSGTAGDPGPAAQAGRLVAAGQAKLQGGRHTAKLINRMAMGSYNAKFKPARTDFDWLSRDTAEVDAYVEDPLCGNVPGSGLYADLLGGLLFVSSKKAYAATPAGLPILVLAGDQDAVGEFGAGPREVAQRYAQAGVSDVELVLYPGGRHEMLSETNRDEVTADIMAWLGARV